MCGIVAIFSRKGLVARDALRQATLSLEHRGPDGDGHWISPDGRVALGHRRLSIIDLKTGAQPIANEDEQLQIIVNGELYGYEAIRQQLERNGHHLRTLSDSEIILHLYEDWGSRCLERLRGEFAFVLWDERTQSIFAARDRFGIKPIFYALHEGALYFASEAKALFAAGVPARWNLGSVYHALEFGGHQTETLFEGVFQIPPGHYLIATDDSIELKQYWDFNYPRATEGVSPKSDDEHIQEFHNALEEAVRIRLRADVPVGCYLSGGIDSCAVLGLAARFHPNPIRAFTLTFDRAEYDESAIAREMAEKVGAEYYPIPISQSDLASHFVDAIEQAETFCVNAHGVAKYLLSRAVHQAGYKVVLTGEGSDEVLGGYLHFRRDALRSNGNGKSASARELGPRLSSPCLHQENGHDLEDLRQLLGFVPGWIETSAVQSVRLHALMTDQFLKQFSQREGFRSFFKEIDFEGQLSGREPLYQSLYLWGKTRLPNYILTMLGDRMEMAHSVEGRVPFLDHHVVEIARSQPINQKIRGKTEKYVLREAVRDIVSETVYRRPKHAFLCPPAVLNPHGQLSVLLQDTLRGPSLASMPFFNQKKIVALLDNLHGLDESSGVANDQMLMMILSACVLQDRFRPSA